MDLSRVIVGQVVTEKAERQKGDRTYSLKVAPKATKIDIQNALKKHFDVEADNVRVMHVGPKVRKISPYKIFTKRSRFKKALVTLSKDSKALDLTQFKV